MRNPGRETVTVVHRNVDGIDPSGRVVYSETTEPIVVGRFVTLSAEETFYADRQIETYDAALLVPDSTNVGASDEVEIASPSPQIVGRWKITGVEAHRGHLRCRLRRAAV